VSAELGDERSSFSVPNLELVEEALLKIGAKVPDDNQCTSPGRNIAGVKIQRLR
jgi:hypothetical protein